MTAPPPSPPRLDALARRVGLRERRRLELRAPAQWGQSGVSRRAVMVRTAVGAAALSLPLQLVGAPAARAADCQNPCRQDAYDRGYDALKACYDNYQAALGAAEDQKAGLLEQLAQARSGRARRAIRQRIARIQQSEAKLTSNLSKCTLGALAKHDKRLKKCNKRDCGNPVKYPGGQVPGPAPSPNPLPPPPAPSCPDTTFQCAGSDPTAPQCCYDGTYCCGCGICCIYQDCRCCG